MKELKTNHYSNAIKAIKGAILKSRYRAAALANREMLSLYYGIGKFVSENSRNGFWGTGAIETISEKLQQELPGLRGFSAGNIKKMRLFYDGWENVFVNRALPMHDLQDAEKVMFTNRSLPTNDLQGVEKVHFTNRPLQTDEIQINLLIEIRQSVADELPPEYKNILPDAEMLKELL